jgi:hypothetical protein
MTDEERYNFNVDNLASDLTDSILDAAKLQHLQQPRHLELATEQIEEQRNDNATQASSSPSKSETASPVLKEKSSTHTLKTKPSQEFSRSSQESKRKDFKKSLATGDQKFTSKSHTLSSIQNLFTDSQKIAYVGLCYLSIANFKKTRLEPHKKALQSYDKWSEIFMEKLYVYLELVPQGMLF